MNNLNQGASIEAERERVGRENAEFTEWWNRTQACPEHSLITENAAHAAWQERARRTPAAQVGAGELLSMTQIDEIVYQCRQSGKDTTYDIVRAAIEADRAQRPVRIVTWHGSNKDQFIAEKLRKENEDLRAQLAAKGQGEPVLVQARGGGTPVWFDIGASDADEYRADGYEVRTLCR